MLLTLGVFLLGILLSLAIGVSLGLLGGGGSVLTVPILYYVFGADAHTAIATSLVVVGTTAAVAVIPHARAGAVRWEVGALFGVASMAGAYGGGRLGALLPASVLMPAFAAIMVIAGVAMIRRARRNGAGASTEAGPPARRSLVRVLAIGIAVGVLTGMLGAGGGFVIVPALLLFGGLGMREAVGTSLLVISLNSFAGVAASHAAVDLRTALIVTVAAIAGSLIGARLARRVAAQDLQTGFGGFVIAMAIVVIAGQLA